MNKVSREVIVQMAEERAVSVVTCDIITNRSKYSDLVDWFRNNPESVGSDCDKATVWAPYENYSAQSMIDILDIEKSSALIFIEKVFELVGAEFPK